MSSDLHKQAHRLSRRAYWQLHWEAYAPALALGVLFVCLYVIGASAGLWQRIGDPFRLLALAAAIFFVVRSVIAARKRLRPTRSNAMRRVEEDSGLAHRPLDTIHDTAALGPSEDPLWREHLRRANADILSARAPKTRPALAPIDKYYLRFAVPAALLLAVMVGAGDNYERIRSALTPGWIHGSSAKTANFEAWIDPPEYTARPPSYFKDKDRLTAPAGSEFVARISGVKTPPRLIVRDGKRTRRITPTRLGPKSFEARAILSKNAIASYRIGSETKAWTLDVEPDRFPSIEFETPPEPGKRDKLIFTYNLQDDFGAEQLFLVMALKTAPDIKDEVAVTLPGRTVRLAEKEQASLDLTKHKWAGKVVIGYLTAVDGKGQIGTSQSEEFIVPDKIFVEPMAKAVVEHRSLLLADNLPYAPLPKQIELDAAPENMPLYDVDRPDLRIDLAPANVQRAALLIEAVTDKPVGAFDDPVVYMGLRNINRRLNLARDRTELAGMPEDLWEIALRAEFGLLGDALQAMQAAERALNNAMARRAPQREIDALFDRYNAAVDRYMEELLKKAIEEAKNKPGDEDGEGGPGPDMQTDEIQELLDAIEEANRMGDTVAARKALARLAQLLENMKIELAQGGGGSGGIGEGMSEELQDALEELNEAMGDQRELRDDTREAGREELDRERGQENGEQGEGQEEQGAQSGGQNQGRSPGEMAQQQREIRELLEKLEDSAGGFLDELDERAGQLGVEDGEDGSGSSEDGEDGPGGSPSESIKDALDKAMGAMRESEEALENSEFFRAGKAQSDAIEALREAGEKMFAEEAKRLAEQEGRSGGDGDGGDEEGVDPFGRADGEGGNGVDDVEIPEIDDRQRARELLEELRRRSGEQERDQIERDYLDRLLERF